MAEWDFHRAAACSPEAGIRVAHSLDKRHVTGDDTGTWRVIFRSDEEPRGDDLVDYH